MNVSRIIFASVLLLIGSTMARAQAVSPYQVKAAFLYNFIKFVEWPGEAFAAPASPYVVGVFGRDPFGSILDETMRGKSINGRPITVQRVSEEQFKECHILFISPSERRRTREILARLNGLPVLTVGEHEGFAESGGIVTFVPEQNKVKFQINVGAAKNAHLKMHPTLLNLAKIVGE